jgi:HD-like signal output (HDOD) protein
VSRHKQQATRPRAATADGAVDAFARGVLAEIERGEEPLLVWSKDVRQVLDELANPKPSTARLSQLVALDPRLAVTTMGVAQSTTFGRLATPSLDLQQTLFALGPDRLRCIVLGAGVAVQLSLYSMPRADLMRFHLIVPPPVLRMLLSSATRPPRWRSSGSTPGMNFS